MSCPTLKKAEEILINHFISLVVTPPITNLFWDGTSIIWLVSGLNSPPLQKFMPFPEGQFEFAD